MDWIQTFTGRRFHPLRPDPAEIDIRDIAHALSLLCRFNGHCRRFYSVAEHSIRVSRAVPREHALAGLLHDAAEAYVSDLPRPVKRSVPAFREMEDLLLEAIFGRYGIDWPLHPSVVSADDALLATEKRDLMGAGPSDWGLDAIPLPEEIEPLDPAAAEEAFLIRYAELLPPAAAR